MHWKLKCAAHWAMSALPRPVYRAIKRRGGEIEVTDAYLRLYRFHLSHFNGGRVLEFGAGQHLLGPLMLSTKASEVITLDIDRIASVRCVNHTIRQLRRLGGEWPEVSSWDDLYAKYRIRYVAPGDARATRLPSGSVDFIMSTTTLEHIPREDIAKILTECRRIAAPSAVMCHLIDYQDHWHYAGAPPFNFYRYGATWPIYNPPTHHQNRLRHSDYAELFSAWDSEVITHEIEVGVPVAECFSRYADLRVHTAYWVLKPQSIT